MVVMYAVGTVQVQLDVSYLSQYKDPNIEANEVERKPTPSSPLDLPTIILLNLILNVDNPFPKFNDPPPIPKKTKTKISNVSKSMANPSR